MNQTEYTERTGRRLKRWRLAFGLSQAELGEAVGVSQASIGNWENGRAVPSAYSLELIRRHFRKRTAARQVAPASVPGKTPNFEPGGGG